MIAFFILEREQGMGAGWMERKHRGNISRMQIRTDGADLHGRVL